MRDALLRLQNAIDQFDIDEADRQMKFLETYRFPAELQSMLERLGAYMADVAMEDITELADTYDAMTSRRSYRGIIPQETVMGELERGKGSQFDPEIAEIMLGLIREDTAYEMHE